MANEVDRNSKTGENMHTSQVYSPWSLNFYGIGEFVRVGVLDPTGAGEPVGVPDDEGDAVLVGVGEIKIAVK